MELREWRSRTASSIQDGGLQERKGKEENYLEEVWEDTMPRLDMKVFLGKNGTLMTLATSGTLSLFSQATFGQ